MTAGCAAAGGTVVELEFEGDSRVLGREEVDGPAGLATWKTVFKLNTGIFM